MKSIYIAGIFLIVLLAVWYMKPDILMKNMLPFPVDSADDSPGAMTVCPPDPMYANTAMYADAAIAAGLDPEKLSACNGIWYYEGRFSCVGSGSELDPCPSGPSPEGTICGSAVNSKCFPVDDENADRKDKYGPISCQMAVLKKVIGMGVDEAGCAI